MQKPQKIKQNKEYFDKELKNLLLKKDKLFKAFLKQKNSKIKEAFAKARNLYFRTVELKKKAFYLNKFNSCKYDIKCTWKLMNTLLGKQKKLDSKCLTIDGNNISDPLLVSNHFNDYFSNISKRLVDCLPLCNAHHSDFLLSTTPNSIFIWPTCPLEISNILKQMKSNVSAGFDQVPSKILKLSQIIYY